MKICHLLGALPPKVKPIFQEDDFLIAVDGGYEYVKNWEVQPDLTVGDFDSLGYQPQEEKIHPLPCEKDETDMEYALKQGIAQGFQVFFLQGGIGGRLDHSFANFQLLLRLAQEGKWAVLLGQEQGAMVLQGKTVEFPVEFTGYLSIFAFGQEATGISLENLAYEGTDLTLSPTVPLGVSNQFLPNKKAKISVKTGALLILWECGGTWEQYRFLLEQG